MLEFSTLLLTQLRRKWRVCFVVLANRVLKSVELLVTNISAYVSISLRVGISPDSHWKSDFWHGVLGVFERYRYRSPGGHTLSSSPVCRHLWWNSYTLGRVEHPSEQFVPYHVGWTVRRCILNLKICSYSLSPDNRRSVQSVWCLDSCNRVVKRRVE